MGRGVYPVAGPFRSVNDGGQIRSVREYWELADLLSQL